MLANLRFLDFIKSSPFGSISRFLKNSVAALLLLDCLLNAAARVGFLKKGGACNFPLSGCRILRSCQMTQSSCLLDS